MSKSTPQVDAIDANSMQPQSQLPESPVDDEAISLPPPLRADSSVTTASHAFDQYMTRIGFSENTIKAFRNDLKILLGFLGETTLLHEIKTEHLHDFIDWLQNGRGKPCSAKSLARRITTVKVFFHWLHGDGVIGTDPALPIAQQPAKPPLPDILREEEIALLQRSAQNLLFNRNEGDARPYLLLNLLLQTGLKKAECARLLVSDVDVSQAQNPELVIRYSDQQQAHKNRRLPIHPSLVNVLKQYLDQYKPDTYLFECTPRNLEYVLDDLGNRAGLKRLQVGFETLRWTCAVRDFRLGMPDERLRLKLGLSKISWRETSEKIHQLAGR